MLKLFAPWKTMWTLPLLWTVESRSGAVAYRAGGAKDERRLSLPLSPRSPSLRFPSPLIELDMTISVIQLSDGFHM